MTTIQDRIIKDYKRIFKETVMWQEHESFLIKSIKEVEQKTRKETKINDYTFLLNFILDAKLNSGEIIEYLTDILKYIINNENKK